jgi:hypothetical protein
LGCKNHTNYKFDVKVISIMLEHHRVGFLFLFLAYMKMAMCTHHGKHISPKRAIKSIICHNRMILEKTSHIIYSYANKQYKEVEIEILV